MNQAALDAPVDAASANLSAAEIIALEQQYLLQNYARYPLVLTHGEGVWLWDTAGKRYLDFISGIGVNSLGHNHPRITRVVQEQATLLVHTSNLYYNLFQGPLAKRICEASGLQRVFFANTGTEAMEGALKMMKAHGRKIHSDKYEIIALNNSFHGRTLGSLSITGQEKYRHDFEPLVPGVRFIDGNDIGQLEAAFNDRTAGVAIEWIQGEGGINPMTHAFCARARELADRYDALLVFDEIQCGVGRPGKYFSYQLHEPTILPDVMVAAKPIACGIPLGVLAANEKAAAAIGSGMHGTTFGGSALACRVALEFFDVLDELLPAINRVGEYFRAGLRRFAMEFDFIKEVRGYGLMVGVELEIPGKQMALDAMADGLLINCTHDTVLRFLPPFIVTEKEVDQALVILRQALAKAPRG